MQSEGAHEIDALSGFVNASSQTATPINGDQADLQILAKVWIGPSLSQCSLQVLFLLRESKCRTDDARRN